MFPAKQEEEGLNGGGRRRRREFVPFSDGTACGYAGGSDVDGHYALTTISE